MKINYFIVALLLSVFFGAITVHAAFPIKSSHSAPQRNLELNLTKKYNFSFLKASKHLCSQHHAGPRRWPEGYGSGFSILSGCFGFLAVICDCLAFVPGLGLGVYLPQYFIPAVFAFAVLAIVLGIIGLVKRKRQKYKGLALLGVILGGACLVSLVIGLLYFFMEILSS